MRRRATQKDVARQAGVSQATVSLVLTGRSAAIPEETLSRISSAARELGYRPNRAAQALKTNRSMTIACVVPDITNPFYPALLRGVQQTAEAQGYDVVAVNTDGLADRERRVLDWSLQGRVDGMIGVFWTVGARELRSVIEGGVAVVRIESARKAAGAIPIDNIFVDGRAGSKAMTDYLLGRGHRRIVMIAGRGGPRAVRVEGYGEAMHAAGAAADVVLDDAFSEEGGRRATRAALARAESPTAIFAANDLMAIGAMQAIHEAGLAVPEEVAVAGFDDIPGARHVSPGLTTVAQFQQAVGARAAEVLIARLTSEAEASGQAIEMPFQLIMRGSA